jgi:hypothetical protein
MHELLPAGSIDPIYMGIFFSPSFFGSLFFRRIIREGGWGSAQVP